MNKKVDINKELLEIGKRTLQKLEELKVPPYPQYYFETFNEFINEHQKAEITNLIQKSPELFCIHDDSLIFEKSLEIARKSIIEFQSSNNSIKDISSKNEIQLEDLTQEDNSYSATNLLKICAGFQEQVAKQLNIADNTIDEMKKQIEKLENDANINPLTKLYNRKILMKDLENILSFGKDKHLDMYVAIFDADDFRKINSNFGHVAGNKTLIYLSKLLQSLLRKGVPLYHSGGEEFSIILNRSTHKEITDAIQRVLKEVRESKLFYKGNNIHLTLSAGFTKHKQDDDTQTILDRAEQALYQAKRDGKNCFKEVN